MPTPQPSDDSLNPANWTGAEFPDGGGVTFSSAGAPAAGGTDIDSLAKGMVPALQEKQAADSRITHDLAAATQRDAYQAHHAYDAEVATSKDIPSWNEEEQRKKFSTDPVKAFGSMGSVFALIASAFTHRPMINALQGSAAAMSAIKEGDDKEYDRAFTAYKTNVDLALKRHDMMHQEYQDANQLMQTDMAAGDAQLKLAAAKYNDKQMLFLLEHGMNDEINKLVKGRADSMAAVAKSNQEITESSLRINTFKSMQQDVEKSGIPKDDPRYATLMAEAGRRAFAGKDTPMDAQMWQWEMQHAQDHEGKGPTAEERQKFYQGFRTTLARETPDMQFLRRYQEEHTEATVEEAYGALAEEKRKQKPEKLPTTSGAEAQAVADMLRDNPDMKKEDAIGAVKGKIAKAIADAKGGNALIDDDTADLMADQYMAGDRTVMQNLGRGAQGAQNIVKIRQSIMRKADQQGLKGADLALRMAEFRGLVAGEAALGTRATNMQLYAGETLKMIDVAEDASKQVPRSQWIPINKALQAFESNTGDPKIKAFGAALNTLVNTYAKAIAGGGQATMSDKEEARKIISSAESQSQFEAVVGVIKKELTAALAAPGIVKQQFREQAGTGSPSVVPPEGQGVIRYDAEGNRVK